MRRFIAGFVALFIFMLVFNYSLPAATPEIKIKINGQERKLDPPCQVKNQRVMVPLRFIAEDQAILAKVDWNGGGQVTIYHRGQRFDFFIGSKTARVNNRNVEIDVAPYTYKGRTFIPLRFFSTYLGASVGWKSEERTVIINFKRPRVFAYYYGDGFKELQERANVLTDVAFRWYQTNEKGEVSYEYSDTSYGYKFEQVTAWAKQKGLKTHAGVMLFDRTKLSLLLNSPQNRQNLINNVKEIVDDHGFDGINIDFEFIAPGDKDSFTQFLRELKVAVGKERTVSVAVFARTGTENWPTAYDYKALGQVSDMVVIMAYDYSFDRPGAIAPIDWCMQVLDYAEKNIPQNKILMGIGAYGYDWEGQTRRSVTQSGLEKLNRDYQVREFFDQITCSPYLIYLDKDGHRHEVWYENRTSLEAKCSLYLERNVEGISFWKINGAFDDFYGILESGLAY